MYGIEFVPLAEGCPAPGSFDCALALGCFDGFHTAHRAIAEEARLLAAQDSLIPGVFCFRDPPAAFFGKDVPVITDTAEKCRLFALAGLKFAFVADFAAIRGISPADFMHDVLYDFCRCRAAACGFNFSFGINASGTPDDLVGFFGHDRVRVLSPRTVGGVPVSSSRIRTMIEDGDIEEAASLLGHPFSVSGSVIHGRGDGVKLGFPTINQIPADGAVRARAGVYISAAVLDTAGDSPVLPAVTDAGVAPTMDTTGVFRYETHLLAPPDRSLYGMSPRVFLLRRLRDEMKFDSPEELVARVEHDTAEARRYFDEHKPESYSKKISLPI